MVVRSRTLAVSWFHDLVVLWPCGIVGWWYCGIAALWSFGRATVSPVDAFRLSTLTRCRHTVSKILGVENRKFFACAAVLTL